MSDQKYIQVTPVDAERRPTGDPVTIASKDGFAIEQWNQGAEQGFLLPEGADLSDDGFRNIGPYQGGEQNG